MGRARRSQVPLDSHDRWTRASDRSDPVRLLQSQDATRLTDLVPIRYGRMVASPFAFLRGSVIVMASDLAATPVTGIKVQAVGDAHLGNFGVFATPERNLVFDANDFDQTLPAPWEWDVKRLATSLVVAARDDGQGKAAQQEVAQGAVRSYREAMASMAEMRVLELWYERHDLQPLLRRLEAIDREPPRRGTLKIKLRDHLRAFSRLTEVAGGHRRIRNDPPLLVRIEAAEALDRYRHGLQRYKRSLPPDRRELVDRLQYLDLALKVVGVGSVGTRCYIVMLLGRGEDDPVFLQIKQAEASVLEAHAGRSPYANHGRRVVLGQRLVQGASDIFLGWYRDREGFDYHVQQLMDMKGSVDIAAMSSEDLRLYGIACGWALARAHARSGDAAAISGYMGDADVFDRAVTAFAEAYADQTERDHARLLAAVECGEVTARTGL